MWVTKYYYLNFHGSSFRRSLSMQQEVAITHRTARSRLHRLASTARRKMEEKQYTAMTFRWIYFLVTAKPFPRHWTALRARSGRGRAGLEWDKTDKTGISCIKIRAGLKYVGALGLTVMGPYPSFISYHRLYAHWGCEVSFPLENFKLQVPVGEL